MSVTSAALKAATKMVVKYLPKAYRDGMKAVDAEKIENIVSVHSLGAAAAGLGSGWIPGAGGTAALMASVGFIWSMYFRINKELGIPLSKTIVKSLGSAVLSNLIGTALSLIAGAVAATILSFTGLGNIASSLIMGAISYAVVFVSGIIYMKLLTELFKAGTDFSEVSAEDMKSTVKEVMKNEDISSMLKDAKDDYKRVYKSGEVSGNEEVDIEEM